MVEYETNTDKVSLTENVTSIILRRETLTDTLGISEELPITATGELSDMVTPSEVISPLRQTFNRGRVIYHFNTTINGSEVKLKDLSITRRLSQIAELKAKYPKDYAVSFDDPITVEWINDDGDVFTVFEGVITKISEVERGAYYSFTAKGLEFYLATDVYATVDVDTGEVQGVFEYNNERADVIAEGILDGTEFTLIECPTDPITVKFDFVNRWKALGLIADILGVDLWVDSDKGVHIGTKRSSANRYENVYKQTSDSSSDERLNRVIIVGGVTSEGKVPIGVAQDGADIAATWPRVKVKKVPQIIDANTAKKLAEVYLDRYSKETTQLRLELAITPVNIGLREGDYITVDSEDYKITRLTVTPTQITVIATPSVAVPNLTSYLVDKASEIDEGGISSDFESSTPVAFTIYENIELSPDPDGDGTDETITIDGTDYTVLGVMHFYTPENFTAESVTIYIRQYSATVGDFGVAVNGVLMIMEEETGDDGKKRWKVNVPAEDVIAGWNDVYFIDTGS